MSAVTNAPPVPTTAPLTGTLDVLLFVLSYSPNFILSVDELMSLYSGRRRALISFLCHYKSSGCFVGMASAISLVVVL